MTLETNFHEWVVIYSSTNQNLYQVTSLLFYHTFHQKATSAIRQENHHGVEHSTLPLRVMATIEGITPPKAKGNPTTSQYSLFSSWEIGISTLVSHWLHNQEEVSNQNVVVTIAEQLITNSKANLVCKHSLLPLPHFSSSLFQRRRSLQ